MLTTEIERGEKMAKYFSTTKTPKNGYTFADLALLLSKLDGADKIFDTKDYKIMIRDAAVLFADKTRPCYLDLSMFIDEKNQCWNDKLLTANQFIKEINKDIFKFQNERAIQRNQEM